MVDKEKKRQNKLTDFFLAWNHHFEAKHRAECARPVKKKKWWQI